MSLSRRVLLAALRLVPGRAVAARLVVAQRRAGRVGSVVPNALLTSSTMRPVPVAETLVGTRSLLGVAPTVTPQQFGATGNGAHLDAPAFRTAIAYLASRGGGTLYVPRGQYNLTSPFVTSGGQNAIIPLPAVPIGSQNIAIRIVGEANIPAFGPPVPTGGVVLFSKTVASTSNGVRPSVIGYSAASFASITWSAITAELHNLTVRVEPDSGVTPIDLYAVANAVLENVTVSTNAAPGSFSAPTNPNSRGLVLPATGNFGWVKAHKIYAIGFYYGIQHSEHADIEGLIQSCISATYIPDSYSHLAKYRITTQGCSYSIYTEAQASLSFGFCNSIYGELDIERDPELPFVADIYAATGALLNGIINYNVAADPNSGVSNVGAGAVHLILNNIAKPQTAQAIVSVSPTSSTTITLLAARTVVVPAGLGGDITITIAPGGKIGQSVRIHGHYVHSVTVGCGVTSGEPAIYLQNNSKTYFWTMRPFFGPPQYIDLTWTGQSWLAEAVGGFRLFPGEIVAAGNPETFRASHWIALYDSNGGGPYYVAVSASPW